MPDRVQRRWATRVLASLWSPVMEPGRVSALARYPALLWLTVSLATAGLMYFSVTQFPYLRADDTFLLRRNYFALTYNAVGEVNLWFIHIMVARLVDLGRPLFWLAVSLTAYLFEEYGLQSLAYVRGIGVGMLGVVGYLLLRHLQAWGYRAVTATCLMALVLALPGFQIIIGNGVWLMPGFLAAMLAARLLMRVDARAQRRLAGYAGVVLLLIAALTVYQTAAFLFVAVAAAALASSSWEQRRDEVVRYVIRSLVLVTVATLVYYVVWTLLAREVVPAVYSLEGNGYAPGMVLGNLPENLRLFAERRVPQVLNLWYAPHISRPLAHVVGWSLVVIWVARVASARAQRGNEALKLFLYALLFGAAESCTIVADYYMFFASRFTTSVAQSVTFLFLLVDTVRWLRLAAVRYVAIGGTAYSVALLAFTVVCGLKAQTQMWQLIVMPSSLETRFVGTQISDFMKAFGRVDEVEIIGLTGLLLAEQVVTDARHPEKVGEFMFGNFGSVTYLHHLARNLTLDIAGQNPARVIARAGDAVSDLIEPGRTLAPDSEDYRVVIDTRQMSVSWRP